MLKSLKRPPLSECFLPELSRHKEKEKNLCEQDCLMTFRVLFCYLYLHWLGCTVSKANNQKVKLTAIGGFPRSIISAKKLQGDIIQYGTVGLYGKVFYKGVYLH